MHVVFRSLLEIFGYAAKQACKQLQCNKAKSSELASINGLHNIRVYARASLFSAYTTGNENRGGDIYTVTATEVGKLAGFDQYRRLSRKCYEISQQFLLITNTKKFFRLWSVTVELVAAASVRDPSLTMTQFCTHLKTFLFRRAYCT